MKKTAAFAFAAILAASVASAAQISGTNFEGLDAGTTIGATAIDYTGSDSYWLGDTSGKSKIAENGEDTYSALVGAPDFWATGAHTKYLAVNAETPLQRTINAINGSTAEAYTIEGNVYIDTLVKFTPSEIVPATNNTDKLVLWMDENTNVMVRARAYVDDQQTSETKEVALTETFNADQWYRLTVIASPGLLGSLHFQIYIDGQLMSASTEDYITYAAELITVMDEAEFDISDAIRGAIANGTLFIADDNGADDSITYIGFEGVGAVDDISFTLEPPAFLGAETTLAFTLALGEGVTGISYTISGTEGTQTTVGEIAVPKDGTITITGITAADWFTTTPILTATTGATAAGSVFTVAAAGATGTIAATPVAPEALVGTGTSLTTSQIKSWAESKSIAYADITAATEADVLNAYLMNDSSLTPSGLKIASIERKVENNVTTVEFTFAKTGGESDTAIASGSDINGAIYVFQGDTIAEMTSATPTVVAIAEGKVAIQTTKKFFKFKVDLPAAE